MADRITDQQLDDWDAGLQQGDLPGAAYGELIAEIRQLRAERDEARAERDARDEAIRVLVRSAAAYDSRVYQIAYMPEFVTRHLRPEDFERNTERPSETDRRVLAERDRLQARIDAALATTEKDWRWCHGKQRIDIARVRAALTGTEDDG